MKSAQKIARRILLGRLWLCKKGAFGWGAFVWTRFETSTLTRYLLFQIQIHIWAFDNEADLYSKFPFLSELFMRIVYMFFFLNSIVNPFVYTFQFQPFKEALGEFGPIKTLSSRLSKCFSRQERQQSLNNSTNSNNNTKKTNTHDCEV